MYPFTLSHTVVNHKGRLKMTWLTWLKSVAPDVEHGPPTNCFHFTWFCAAASSEPHVTPASFISCSTPLFQVFFGLPLFLCHWGFHFRALLAMLSLGFLNVYPIHVHLLLSRTSADSCSVAFHSPHFSFYRTILFRADTRPRKGGWPWARLTCSPILTLREVQQCHGCATNISKRKASKWRSES